MIVQYYADSLGLSRPGFVELNQRYIYLFENWLKENKPGELFLINRARRGYTIDQLSAVYFEDEEYITGTKEVLIIHEGVCDCAPRPVSKKIRRIISKLPGFLKFRIISYLHKNRARLLRKGSVHYLVEKEDYEKLLTKWLQDAVTKFNRIYLLNIAPTNEGIENHSPGFGKSINEYNKIIENVVTALNNPVIKMIDIHSLIAGQANIDDFIIREDGHHITVKAHQLIADKLIAMERQVM